MKPKTSTRLFILFASLIAGTVALSKSYTSGNINKGNATPTKCCCIEQEKMIKAQPAEILPWENLSRRLFLSFYF